MLNSSKKVVRSKKQNLDAHLHKIAISAVEKQLTHGILERSFNLLSLHAAELLGKALSWRINMDQRMEE